MTQWIEKLRSLVCTCNECVTCTLDNVRVIWGSSEGFTLVAFELGVLRAGARMYVFELSWAEFLCARPIA